MNKTALRSTALIFLLACTMLAVLPSISYSFKNSGSSEGQCSKCHSITPLEAKKILKELVNEVHAVELSEVPGLYIIDATGKNGKRGVLYMDFSKSYIVSGSFMSIADRKNVTKREMLGMRRVDLTTIPLADSVVIGDPGAPKKLILFTDPQCPFCIKLHPELQKVVDADPSVVFYIKMMPIISLHPDALRISKAILCEGSVKLLEDSFAGKKVPDPTCVSDAVDRTVKLAQELGIGSTPTLVLPDGRILPGYRPAEDILKLIKGEQ